MASKVKNKYIFAILLILLSVFVITGTIVHASNDDSLIGKWGYVNLEHNNDGIWKAEAGNLILNSDGTGTLTYKDNYGGTLSSESEDFTYSTTANQDGSITLTLVLADGIDTAKIVLSDNGNMFIVDGTADITEQSMVVAIRMDESKTCSNTDFSGEYYEIAYEYDPNETSPPSYKTWSGIGISDGNGNFDTTETVNENGTIYETTDHDDYSINPDCSISDGSGYLTGDGKLVISSTATKSTEWVLSFGMKKGDMDYSTASPVGTFAMVGFGDYGGTSFSTMFGTMTCYSSGKCMFSFKNQQDGNITYFFGSDMVTISPDGSVTSSNSAGSPSYAVAVGNNGNTIISNVSFSPNHPSYPNLRLIQIGVRCSDCSNLAGEMIPMIQFDLTLTSCADKVINLYLYDTDSGIMNTVKKNCNVLYVEGSLHGSLNTSQTMMVYAELVNGYTGYIYVYDIASKTSTLIASLTRPPDFPDRTYRTYDLTAYFDNNNKIIFNGSDGTLKRMDSDGTNITTIATPESPYKFGMFWLSPDREKIVVNEFRQEGPDYLTGNYERLVLMDSDGTGRTVIMDEYLGQWSLLSWRPDSSGFLYYHLEFNVVDGVYQKETPQYVLIDISDGAVTDLSDSDMGKMDNICFYTKSSNLLSLSYRELFNGETGDLIRDVSGAPSYVPLFTETLFGFESNGEIYFADLDGSNFRRFVEAVGYPFSPYDTNQDWIIGDFELLNAIDEWATGNLGNFELLDLIDFWAFGSYCWDAAAGSHKTGVPDGTGAC